MIPTEVKSPPPDPGVVAEEEAASSRALCKAALPEGASQAVSHSVKAAEKEGRGGERRAAASAAFRVALAPGRERSAAAWSVEEEVEEKEVPCVMFPPKARAGFKAPKL